MRFTSHQLVLAAVAAAAVAAAVALAAALPRLVRAVLLAMSAGWVPALTLVAMPLVFELKLLADDSVCLEMPDNLNFDPGVHYDARP